MKTLMLLVLVAALGSSVCHKSDVRKWEELPNDIAGNLKRIPDSDVLVSIAPIADPNPEPSPIFARACSERQDYWVQVIYPVTICTRLDLVPGTFIADAPPRRSGPRVTTVTKTYKLSAFEGQPLTSPFGCQTYSGPFIAQITKTIACNGAQSCEMVIIGVPACPTCPPFVWSGDQCEDKNRPAEVRFIEPTFAHGPPRLSPCNAVTHCGSTPD